jgi:hypothetical protein
MSDIEINEVLIAILEMLKQQGTYLHRQHGWMIALAETMEENDDLAQKLKQHPFYDQGPRRDTQITDVMIRNIDALIQQLRKS